MVNLTKKLNLLIKEAEQTIVTDKYQEISVSVRISTLDEIKTLISARAKKMSNSRHKIKNVKTFKTRIED